MAAVRQLSVAFFLMLLLMLLLFSCRPCVISHPPSSDNSHGCRLMTCPSLYTIRCKKKKAFLLRILAPVNCHDWR
ncbi:hypothetical protein BDP81DRAFT_416053 [Colletotrichum phormii]|uniref:Secreted protein n=1 Tax=Colletotrichum phormii TaxID=359342 RepID=A0AAJ0EML3_9PEZI|nr:uncharacterized protein BDP81DRAFT_416053 [Colletotrichum phormii]KAK1654573.1 hypothetical protein BDP81DRAFT_416053 [Colletotrichum phormii]